MPIDQWRICTKIMLCNGIHQEPASSRSMFEGHVWPTKDRVIEAPLMALPPVTLKCQVLCNTWGAHTLKALPTVSSNLLIVAARCIRFLTPTMCALSAAM